VAAVGRIGDVSERATVLFLSAFSEYMTDMLPVIRTVGRGPRKVV
jgi:hypothetical protein